MALTSDSRTSEEALTSNPPEEVTSALSPIKALVEEELFATATEAPTLAIPAKLAPPAVRSVFI